MVVRLGKGILVICQQELPKGQGRGEVAAVARRTAPAGLIDKLGFWWDKDVRRATDELKNP